VKAEDQIKALHVYVDEDNVIMAKPLLLALYPSKPGDNHNLPMMGRKMHTGALLTIG